jgi:hypothetical protein
MKKFIDLHLGIKWTITLISLLILVYILNWWIVLINNSVIGILLIFIIVPLIQFLITPLFTLLKLYTYYSPMLVVFGSNNRVIDLHNGTSFDYLFEMRKIKPGIQWERQMLSYYLQGLIEISNQIECNRISKSVVIRGSSYFISHKTATRLNFEVVETSILEKINIFLNYIDLFWTYSLSKGKIVFPKLTKIKTVRTTGQLLSQNKQKIIDMENHLNKRLSMSS